jgi:hypothetical protein
MAKLEISPASCASVENLVSNPMALFLTILDSYGVIIIYILPLSKTVSLDELHAS